MLDVNEAPVNTMPARVETDEDVPLMFGAVPGSVISVGDPDVNGSVRVTLSVSAGTLTLQSRSGLTFATGDGVNDGSMRFTGGIAAVNGALRSLRFTPAADASAFEVVVRDGGVPIGTGRTTVTVVVTAAPLPDDVPAPGPAPTPAPSPEPNAEPTPSSAPKAAPSGLQARNDIARATTGTPETIAVLANDTIADPTRIVVEVGPAGHGSVRVLPDGSVLYSADPGFEGIDRFSYTILGEAGDRSSAVVEVVVALPSDLRPAWLGRLSSGGPTLDSETLIQTAERELQVGFLVMARALLDTLQTLDVPVRLFVIAGGWLVLLGLVLLYFRRRRAFLVDGVARCDALDVLDRPDGELLYQLRFDEGPVWSTGRRRRVHGRTWLPMRTPAGRGFIEARHVLALDRAVDSPRAVLGGWR